MNLVNPYILGSPSPPAILFDDFNDGSIDSTKWERIGAVAGFTVTETGGYIEIMSGGTAGNDGLKSKNAYSAVDRIWKTEIVTFHGGSGETYWVCVAGGDYWGFHKGSGGQFWCEYTGGSVTSHPYSSDPSLFRYLRLVHDSVANEMRWDRSPDGVTWTNLRTKTGWSGIVSLATMANTKWHYQCNGSTVYSRANFFSLEDA